MDLLLGSTNKGKMIEVSDALINLPIRLLSPLDKHITESPHEDGVSFEENALLKAQFYFKKSQGIPTLADDSGIIVDALKDELGIHTRRWGAGATATDEEWIEHFLRRMRNEENKRATFFCSLCFIDKHGGEKIFTGRCTGIITQDLEASYLPGLPISACFKPDEKNAVYSALTIEEKNSISHRGKALSQFAQFMKEYLALN